jgi:hypothetical protein
LAFCCLLAANRLPAASTIPDYVQENLDAIAAPLLQNRKWTPVKIPGMEPGMVDAHAGGAPMVWRNVAPGFTNVIYDMRVSRGVITAVLDLGGVIQSTDGGTHWRSLSYRMPGNGVYPGFFTCEVSPANPDLILLGGSRLARTQNHGQTWEEVYSRDLPEFRIAPTPGMNHEGIDSFYGKIRFNQDGSRVFTALGAFGHDYKPRYKDWDAEAVMGRQFSQKRVFVGDASASRFTAHDLGGFAGIRCIAPHPSDPDVVYFSFGDGTLFITRNARASTPVFRQLTHLSGHQVIDIDLSPGDGATLLLTEALLDSPNARVHKVFKATHSLTDPDQLVLAEVVFKNASGAVLTLSQPVSAKWNPRVQDQMFVGVLWASYLLRSDNAGESFQKIEFPEGQKYGESEFYFDPQWLSFDPHSNLMVTWSCIGSWYSNDGFVSWNDLLMRHNNGYWSNKGVGFAESAASIAIAGDHAFLATHDHGIFKSKAKDFSQWERISNKPGMPQANGKPWASLHFPMGVRQDGQLIYSIARGATDPYSSNCMKLMRSLDAGESWAEVTHLLSSGELLPNTFRPIQFEFGEGSAFQWLLFDKILYVSVNHGASFTAAVLPSAFEGCSMRSLYFDAPRSQLYVLTNRGVARSNDGGVSFDRLTDAYTSAIGTNANGDLIMGLGGHLVVIPREQVNDLAAQGKINHYLLPRSCIRATIGDQVLEATSSLNLFSHINCQGNRIVVGMQAGAYHGTRNCSVGPLISTDGGATFFWETRDLPTSHFYCIAMDEHSILLGCSGGVFWRDLQEHPVDTSVIMAPIPDHSVQAGQPLQIQVSAYPNPENLEFQASAAP